MASHAHTSEASCIESFRASVAPALGDRTVADQLCSIGEYFALSPDEQFPASIDKDHLVYLASGAAKLVSLEHPPLDAQTRGHILGFHFADDIVSILRKPGGGSSLTALTHIELVAFSAEEFLDIAQADPALLRSVLIKSLDSLQRTRTRMIRIGHQTARQRIAGFLVNMAERICGCMSGPCEIALPMGRSDIGDSLGLTIETVSRQFTELRKSGLISTPGRGIVGLSDIDALKCEAGL
ncbi:Crp/Fnr family transcriptional regulator [Erythrobacter insulae]|uniref:Crp/Fnr family transcriptional regulator n=1 Tax=Erythrobacter insulae TaxID=2584124 RepID=A0A547P9T0_9SPHN|nr:Crp/Fnr family transcriptional regulator [Erythrobacter insulae]TRD10880.1 Crp/Fnr family transcriptional regulator [Erythrobacter insulae]